MKAGWVRRWFAVVVVGALVATGCGGGSGDSGGASTPPDPAVTEAVAAWNDAVDVAIAAGGGDATAQLLIYPMAAIAAHDALNGIEARYARFYNGDPTQGSASAVAAVAKAVRDVLVATLPDATATVDARYTAALANVPMASARDAGIAVGAAAAARVIADRGSNVGSASRPFALTSSSQFRVAPPYGVAPASQAEMKAAATATAAYAADYNEVKCIGRNTGIVIDGCADRSAEQTEIALFWLESVSPGWNRIARRVGAARSFDGWQLARLLALLHIAVTDSQIACFDSKAFYDFWRPVVAIEEAANDGNPATDPVANWSPLRTTPGTRDYPSAHANGGDAASAVLASVFGADTAFSTTSGSLSGVTGSYGSFDQAAAENGVSRIYVGYHFRHATEVGRAQGRQVGEWTIANRLLPL